MTPRRVRTASWVIAAADAAIVAWGLLALFFPGQLIPGYEYYTGHSWPALMHTSPATGHFILVAFRLVGALNIAVGLPLGVIALTAFRARQRWAWWTLLAANTIAFGTPITYDLTTGAIGPFELLEWVLLAAVLLALATTWRFFLPRAKLTSGLRCLPGQVGGRVSHGLGCDWRHWSRQIGWIARARRVVVADVRGGAGKTRWAKSAWTTKDMAADIFAVGAGLGLRRPALVGIGMGGTVAPQCAHPPRSSTANWTPPPRHVRHPHGRRHPPCDCAHPRGRGISRIRKPLSGSTRCWPTRCRSPKTSSPPADRGGRDGHR